MDAKQAIEWLRKEASDMKSIVDNIEDSEDAEAYYNAYVAIANLIDSLANPKGNIIYVHQDDWTRLQLENKELTRQAEEAFAIIREQNAKIAVLTEALETVAGLKMIYNEYYDIDDVDNVKRIARQAIR